MATAYTVRIIDRLLRFDTTDDDIVVTLLPFATTPNAPYEMHKTSMGDGNTVTIQVDPTTSDFLLADGSTSIVLDDTNYWAIIKIPQNGESPAFVTSGGTGGGSGPPGGGTIVPAPPVTIGTATVIPRETDQVEVDVTYTAGAGATKANYSGCHVYVEDPDISSAAELPLDGSSTLDGSSQVSGQWNPQRVQDTQKSPVAVLIPEGDVDRQVRIYLLAFGPNSSTMPVRANDTTQTPTPSIVATIPAVTDTYISGMESAWLVTDVGVKVNTEYNLAPPLYTLTFSYTPPTSEQESHRPPGINPFGGVAIWYEYFDTGRRTQAMTHPYIGDADPVGNVVSWQSIEYTAGKGSFRVYFVSMDDGGNQNHIVPGITPFADVSIDPNPPVPKVTNLRILDGTGGVIYLPDGSFLLEATFAWDLPAADLVRYAGIDLYRMATTGTAPCPAQIWPQTPSTDTQALVQIHTIPDSPETWTVAAVGVDSDGQLENNPSQDWGGPDWTCPVVAWTVGPPGIGTIGGGEEYAPLVTINAGATVVPTESTSSDGVRMVTFAINGTNGAWTEPTDNRFGGAWVALVVNGDYGHAIYWRASQADPVTHTNHFTTPAIPAPGSFGQAIGLQFFIISQDPQDHRNTLQQTKTPYIPLSYTPTEGVIIPSRNPLTPQWFSAEFFWQGNALTVDSIGAGKIQVGSLLQVGGRNSFAGSQNGQIAVYDIKDNLVGWIGTAVYDGSAQQNAPAGTYGGAWFGQLWVGGDSPSHAPVFVNQEGVVVVGGIAAAQGAQYPYISVRDAYGIERGRIGAQLTNPPAPGDGGAQTNLPPGLTAGAWFTQLAAGGSSFSNWQVLIDGSQSPGKFYIRDTDQFSISYAASAAGVSPVNYPYIISMGKSVWAGTSSANNTYNFPGIQIYEASGTPPQQIFGSILLNRGLVLRGRPEYGNRVLVSLVMWNGDQQGSDSPTQFWGQLSMYSATSPSTQVVDLASGTGDGTAGNTTGDAHLYLSNAQGQQTFTVDGTGQIHFKNSLWLGWNPGKQLIDSNGNWVGGGVGITSVVSGGPGISAITNAGVVTISNTGVTQINGGNGISVSGVTGQIVVSLNSAASVTFNAVSAYSYGGGAFGGAGVNVGANGVTCGGVTCSGTIVCHDLTSSTGITVDGGITAYGFNPFVGGTQYTGWTGTFPTNNGKNVYVYGGAIVNVF